MALSGIIQAMLVGVALLIGAASYFFYNKQEDNPLEEFSEQLLDDVVGINVDLTPNSPEQEELEDAEIVLNKLERGANGSK